MIGQFRVEISIIPPAADKKSHQIFGGWANSDWSQKHYLTEREEKIGLIDTLSDHENQLFSVDGRHGILEAGSSDEKKLRSNFS